MFNSWKTRAIAAETENTMLRAALDTANEHLNGIELRFADRATLVSITREGRLNRFTFVRNGQLTIVETYSTMEDDLPGWKRALLERMPDDLSQHG